MRRKKFQNLKEKPQKERAVLETAKTILFALAESSKNIPSQTNFLPNLFQNILKVQFFLQFVILDKTAQLKFNNFVGFPFFKNWCFKSFLSLVIAFFILQCGFFLSDYMLKILDN